MTTNRYLRFLIVTVTTCAAILTAAACGDPSTSDSPAEAPSDMGQASYITADSLAELVAVSSAIVVAEVTGKGEVVNMARNPNDVSEPDDSTFILGQVYHVTVDRYLKGSGADTLDVLQPEGFVNQERVTISQDIIDQSRSTYPHIPMDAGDTYLLFLKPTEGFPDETYYTGVMHPWRFTLADDGMARPESPWHRASDVFPPRPAATLIAELETLTSTS